MATPVGRDVGEALETVGNAVVDLFLVGVGLVVRFADTLGHDLGVALAMASVFTIRTLHARGVLEEFSTERTAHNVVELLCDELVALLLVNLFLLLTHGTLTIETNVEGAAILQLLGEAHRKVDPTEWLQSKPGIDHDSRGHIAICVRSSRRGHPSERAMR